MTAATAPSIAPSAAFAPPGFGAALGAVFRQEVRSLLFQPQCYIFQIGFLLALTVCIFLIAEFYATDEASLRLMVVYLPWVALILVPALAMRAWPAEHGERSGELAMTLPLGVGALVLGKFLAGFAVLLIVLLFTSPFAASVAYLGDPDLGAMLATYLAAALLLGAYFALALQSATLAREPIGAFVLALAVLFALITLGWDVLTPMLEQALPAAVIDSLSLYSPAVWFERMSRGWIDIGGAAYFAAVTAAALWTTGRVVAARRAGPLVSAAGARRLAPAVAAWAAVVVLVPLAARSPLGVDLTEAREFTLHTGTLAVLAGLPEDTRATLYWSASESSVPANIKAHARRIRSMLSTMAARSNGRLSLREVDPKPDTDAELQALGDGVRRIPMSSGDRFFLGLTVAEGGRSATIPYLDIRRDRLSEYDIAVALSGLTRSTPLKLGILSPLVPSTAAQARRDGLSFLEELKRQFDLAVIPHFTDALPEGLDVLLVMDATILRSDMLYAIDQFVMRGGGLIVLMDPFVRAHRASNAVNPEPSSEINDLSDLLLRYGLRYLGEGVVGDLDAASVVQDRDDQRMSYPFWMRIRDGGLSPASPVTAGLNEVLMVESGSFEILAAAGASALISAGPASGTLPRDAFARDAPRDLALAFAPGDAPRVVAAVLEGPLASAFDAPPAAASGHVAEAVGAPVVIAVADVDWVFDAFSVQAADVGGETVVRPLNDNLSLLQNMIEYAGGNRSLIAIRSRGRVQRPFTRVQTLFRQAEARLRDQEQALVARLNEVEARMSNAVEADGVSDLSRLPESVQDEIVAFREEYLSTRRALRDIRHQIREDVDALGRRIVAANLLAGPLLVALLWLSVAAWRRRAARRLERAGGR
jgi:ABC-2 type transport system permease protein